MKKNIISMISTILIICLSFHSLYTSIAQAIDKDSIKSNIQNNLLSGIIYDDKGNKTEIFRTILKLTKLDEETVIKLMENETADNILTDIVNSIYDYNLTGDSSYKYTKERIVAIVEDNIDKVLYEIDYYISSEDRRAAINYTRNNTDYILNTIYSTDIGDYKPC